MDIFYLWISFAWNPQMIQTITCFDYITFGYERTLHYTSYTIVKCLYCLFIFLKKYLTSHTVYIIFYLFDIFLLNNIMWQILRKVTEYKHFNLIKANLTENFQLYLLKSYYYSVLSKTKPILIFWCGQWQNKIIYFS